MPLNPSMTCTDLSLTKHCEGLRLAAYPDQGGWRIGYGSTPDGVRPGMTCTSVQAEYWLEGAMQERVDYLNSALNVPPSQQVFNALCDAAYNIIPAEFHKSTLMQKASAGDWDGAWLELPKWRLAGGSVSINLEARRRLEQALWLTGEWVNYLAAAHNQPWWPAQYEATA